MTQVTITLKGGPYDGQQMQTYCGRPFVYAGKIKTNPNHKKLRMSVKSVEGELSVYKKSVSDPLVYIYHRF